MRKGYLALTADIIHPGHTRYIRRCREQVDYLVVGVMTDESVERYKGARPLMTYAERSEVVENIKGVDLVVPQGDFDFDLALKEKGYIIFDSLEHTRNGADVVIPRTDGISSSDIKKRLYERLNYSERKI